MSGLRPFQGRGGLGSIASGGGVPARRDLPPATVGQVFSLRGPCPGFSLHRAKGDAIRTIATAERQLDLNANVQLCVEGLLIRLSRLMQA